MGNLVIIVRPGSLFYMNLNNFLANIWFLLIIWLNKISCQFWKSVGDTRRPSYLFNNNLWLHEIIIIVGCPVSSTTVSASDSTTPTPTPTPPDKHALGISLGVFVGVFVVAAAVGAFLRLRWGSPAFLFHSVYLLIILKTILDLTL